MEDQPTLQLSDRLLRSTLLRFIPMTVKPNHITWIRIFATPFIIWPITNQHVITGISIFILASLTDLVDGAMARTRNQITLLGKILDPVADKLLVSSLMLSIVATKLSARLAITVVGLEILFLLGGLYRQHHGAILQANWLGKIKMNFQLLGVLLVLLFLIAGTPLLLRVAYGSFVVAIFFALASLSTEGF